MTILILGAGVQGTYYGVRLALAGHDITLVARGHRVAELENHGAVIRDALTGKTQVVRLPVIESIEPETNADVCLVTVRREQISEVLPQLQAATGLRRIVFLVNHANGSKEIIEALGRSRVVLAFPGVAGVIEEGEDRYVEVSEQPTSIESDATDILTMFRNAGIRVLPVSDMDAWLQRHAVFVTSIAGAIYLAQSDAKLLARSAEGVRTFILAIREGWSALDRKGVAPAPLPLRIIFSWVPLFFSVRYWRALIGSPSGEFYFARHARHAPAEMHELANDVRRFTRETPTPYLDKLFAAIDQRLQTASPNTPIGPTEGS